MDFIGCRNFGPSRGTDPVKWIILHTAEAAEKPYTARAVANWGAGPDAPRASWHYVVDAIEVIACVREDYVAWGAPGANRFGIHVEHAGYASQTPDEWDDDYSRAVLCRSAELVRDIAERHSIPLCRISAKDLQEGQPGICGHLDVTAAFSRGVGHQDPGKYFPWEHYMALLTGQEVDLMASVYSAGPKTPRVV